VAEIHGAMEGFANFNLDGEVTGDSVADLHEQAVKKGNVYMKNDVLWCLKNYKP
jgi:hypothetical protein